MRPQLGNVEAPELESTIPLISADLEKGAGTVTTPIRTSGTWYLLDPLTQRCP